MYLVDGPNVRYALNLKIPGGEAFVPREGEVLGLIRARDMGYVKRQHANVRPPLYNRGHAEEGKDHFARLGDGMAALMKERGVEGEPLAIDYLRAGGFLALAQKGIQITDAALAIEHGRSVKTEDEVAIYRRIGEQYAYTIKTFRNAIRPGISENQLAAIVVSAWYEAGGEDISQLNVCSGENMNPWRRWPTQRTLKPGDFVGIDLHARGVGGLRGDASRTYFVGDQPSAEQRDLYRRAYEYLQASIGAFRAGLSFAEAADRVPEVPEKYQAQLYYFSLAHAIGMTPGGYPKIDKGKVVNDTLKPNHILAVECYFGEVGSPLAVKFEEQILVCDGNPEVLGPGIPFDDRLLQP
jgi:Xaa-Pro aminopeptidase